MLGHLFFVAQSINPLGGNLVSIPFAVIKLRYPAWLAAVAATPLAYVQVAAVDAAWSALERRPWWSRLIERRRSERLERLAASGGAFLSTAVLAPLVGPWLVMAVMRYARVPQRRIALPILAGLLVQAVIIAGLSAALPHLFARAVAGR